MLARRCLIGSVASVCAAAAAGAATGERYIWARNSAGEDVAVAYRAGNAYHPAALARLRRLLRDVRENEEGPLPPLLIDVLSVLQERLTYSRPLIIASGFRTARTNSSLEGAAPASLHMRGMAVDIHVPGMNVDRLGATVWMLSRRLGFMGVGLYSRFVHLDVGPQRVWTRFDSFGAP
jgi:uncharacterized protein YcbK (DUF882 family)